jgi:hypothetical protein
MFIAQLLRMRFVAAIALALALAGAAYGFAASNTVETSGAGDGNAAISGYHVSNVAYTLNATDPSKIDSMSFTVTPDSPLTGDPSEVHFQVTSGGGATWYEAAEGTGQSWTYDFAANGGAITAASVTTLRVVATGPSNA